MMSFPVTTQESEQTQPLQKHYSILRYQKK
ncbi:hypothetical protein E2I00_011636 [Balaenoptera physalus]|uniref:Uncharacterized protein n=1 Tax=Balaenoptera physalus TaxID=9770 RepID=A0A643C139_BALPH|nr:hypothetical protein E2I00_011636 [Balaenoptera physalus]